MATPTMCYLPQLKYSIRTLFLFTRTDLKTILFPITVFACATAPLRSLFALVLGMAWIWTHLLQCNVSNQYRSILEDAINKPWRPLPARRIDLQTARVLRWTVPLSCIAMSSLFGAELVWVSLALTLTTIMYDEVGLSGHWLGKNFCGVFGYATFQIGATMIMGHAPHLDTIALRAVSSTMFLIFTTLHAQDFADFEGDSAAGRVTIPILFPSTSRVTIFLALSAWSLYLSRIWDVGLCCSAALIGAGSCVGWRYFRYRNTEADKLSYTMYNLWLFTVFLIPAHARWRIFSF